VVRFLRSGLACRRREWRRVAHRGDRRRDRWLGNCVSV